VTEFVRHGLTNRAIAELHGVSVDAVKFHVGNVLAKLGFARRDQLRRWKGVRNDSNLAKKERAMQEPVVLGPIGQIARSVSDIAAAQKWYSEALGLHHLYTFGKLAFFDCNGVRLFLSESDEDGSAIIYFKVADIRAAHAELEARDVEFSNAPHLIHRHQDGTEEWMAFFNDNEGRPLAIMSQVPCSSQIARESNDDSMA
jgi:DNA-binding CsgD family transcriptional regulator/catechol 2,3-dioxygenase-like lactoylglutathione lyase family enzyme